MTQQMPTTAHQLPLARFLSAITTSGAAQAAAQRLAVATVGRTYLLLNAAAPSEPDDGTDVQPGRERTPTPVAESGFSVTITAARIYRPKGKTLIALQTLRAHGTLSSAGLHKAAGLPPKSIISLLEAPLAHGLVRRIEGRPIVWELA